MENIDSSTALIVLSDHGFNSFHRAVHINSWLRANGFLSLKDDNLKSGREFFEDVDWSKTKAYALGFGGIYINQRGREGKGIVSSGNEKEQLKREISDRLYQWRDFAKQRLIVKKVYTSEEIFYGPCINDAPDLFIGFSEGYRASWQTALGAVPENLIEDNLKPWSGDHLCDPSVVPGIFLANQKLDVDKLNIVDIVFIIFQLLGIKNS
jgi:predicted AlkP superfamily phosphohydrolase/phosphomutase